MNQLSISIVHENWLAVIMTYWESSGDITSFTPTAAQSGIPVPSRFGTSLTFCSKVHVSDPPSSSGLLVAKYIRRAGVPVVP